MAKRQPPESIMNTLARVAREHGLPVDVLRKFAGIESSFNPRARTGSYKGMFQLSDEEFRRGGGRGNIYDAEANAQAFAHVLKSNATNYERTTGKPATGQVLYILHQQGTEGGANHLENPGKLAWKNMWATREGQERGPGWAKKAIWGNIPPTARKAFGRVENVTSGQFTTLWNNRYNREGGKAGAEVAFDPSGAAPPMPERGTRVASNTPVDPSQQVVMVGGGEEPPPVPDRRNMKFDYRAPEYASNGGGELPPSVPRDSDFLMPNVSTETRRARGSPLASPATGGLSPEDSKRAFGGTFGDLYARPDQGAALLGGLPPRPPLLKDIFG